MPGHPTNHDLGPLQPELSLLAHHLQKQAMSWTLTGLGLRKREPQEYNVVSPFYV